MAYSYRTTISFSTDQATCEELRALLEGLPGVTRSRFLDASLEAVLNIPPEAWDKIRNEKPLRIALTEMVRKGCEALGYV